MDKKQAAISLYNEAKNSLDKEKLLKKAIKLDYNNLDIRLAYIEAIKKPKKKINEYDCLITEEIKKISNSEPELSDLERLLKVARIYILEAFNLGFNNEAIECGLLCLRLNKNDDYNIRYLLTNHIFKLNRLQIYYNYYSEFDSLPDLLSDLICASLSLDYEMFKKSYDLIIKINPNLIDLLNDKNTDDKDALAAYNLYYESIILAKNDLNNYLKTL